jgi:DNA-binding protein H-NS
MSEAEVQFEIQKIKPGILVTEWLHRQGGIHYKREVLENYLEDKKRIREWKTFSIIDNEDEYKERTNVISVAYAKLRRLCVTTSVGLICPRSREKELKEIITEIRTDIDAFNNKASTCEIAARWGFFEIDENNQAAIAAIADHIAEIADSVDKALTQSDLEALRRAPVRFLKSMTPEAIVELPDTEKNAILARVRAELIRVAIADARHFDSIVTDEVASEVKTVVKQARKIARDLCKKVEKKNQAIDTVLSEVDISGIRKLRASFVMAAYKADQKAAAQNKPTQVAATISEVAARAPIVQV